MVFLSISVILLGEGIFENKVTETCHYQKQLMQTWFCVTVWRKGPTILCQRLCHSCIGQAPTWAWDLVKVDLTNGYLFMTEERQNIWLLQKQPFHSPRAEIEKNDKSRVCATERLFLFANVIIFYLEALTLRETLIKSLSFLPPYRNQNELHVWEQPLNSDIKAFTIDLISSMKCIVLLISMLCQTLPRLKHYTLFFISKILL